MIVSHERTEYCDREGLGPQQARAKGTHCPLSLGAAQGGRLSKGGKGPRGFLPLVGHFHAHPVHAGPSPVGIPAEGGDAAEARREGGEMLGELAQECVLLCHLPEGTVRVSETFRENHSHPS